MAGKIKGITIEFGGDSKPLQKALSDVNKKSRDLQSELRSVDKLLKLDPKNTEIMAQKQKLLAEAVENSKEKLNRLKDAQQQVNEQFAKGEISEEQYREFQREIAKTEQELKGFESQLKATGTASKSLGDKLNDAGKKMQSIGSTMTKYITVPLAAAGAGMVAMGAKFDDSFDKIRIGTGATGKALEGLNKDFRAVAKTVPSSFDEISTAIADYNTRLNLSGEALQKLSTQTLNLARITEMDLSKIIEETSQAFMAFKVPTENYGKALDFVFKVTQSTGISLDRLEQNLVKFAPALKGMGFDFYESATLMGFLDKAGVETEQAMVGLNKALVNMAKSGVTDAGEALQKLFEEIKNAPNDVKATEIAIEIFGSKAGPALASAIREGKLEYQGLIEELIKSKETINDVAAETDDWAEKLEKLKNRTMIATEPLANEFFNAVNELIDPLEDELVPAIEGLAEGFSNLPKPAQEAAVGLVGIAAAIGPIIQGIGMIVMAAPALGPIFTALGAIISGVFMGLVGAVTGLASTIAGAAGILSTVFVTAGQVIAGAVAALAAALGISVGAIVAIIAGIVVAGYLLIKNWDEIKAFGIKLWDDLKEGWNEGMDSMSKAFSDFGAQVSEAWNNLWAKTMEAGNNIKEAITSPIKSAMDTILGIIQKIKDAFANLKIEIPKPKLPHISVDWKTVGTGPAKVSIPDFNLNWYKTGGVFASPSIIGVGEAGKEVVYRLIR